MEVKFPKGYAVVLTDKGAKLVGSILGTTTDLTNIKFENIMSALQDRVSNLISQQKVVESVIGDDAINALYRSYAFTSPTTLVEKSKTEIDRLKKGNAAAQARYKSQEERLNKILDKRKQILTQWIDVLADLKAAGRIEDGQAAVAKMKEVLKKATAYDKQLTEIESDLIASQKNIQNNGEEIVKISQSLQKLVESRLSGGTYTFIPQTDGRILVEGTKEAGTQAIQEYVDYLLDATERDAQKIHNKKYTSYGFAKEGQEPTVIIGKERAARQKLLNDLEKTVGVLDQDLGKKLVQSNMPKITDGIANVIKTGEEQTIAIDTGKNSNFVADAIEGGHVKITNWSELRESFAPLGIISAQNTGSNQSRIMAKAKGTYDVQLASFTHDDNIDGSGLPDSIEATEFETEKVYDKIDNLFTITGNSSNYYIAISDKFRYSYSLQNLPLVGNFNPTTQEATPGSLLNNIDLFAAANDDLVEKLIFILLNMSSASFLQFSEMKIQPIVEQMVSTYLLELAFNIQDFVEGMEREMTKENTLCLFNFADSLFIKASQVLEGIYQQLERCENIEDIVTVQVLADTTHQALPLWAASLKAEPTDQKARWRWVANQVANNTQLSVKMNVQALLQFFKRK